GATGQGDFAGGNRGRRLPVRQKPGADGGFVKAPAPKFVPPGHRRAAEFKGCGELAASLTKRNLKVVGTRLGLGVKCPAKWRSCDGGEVVIRGADKEAKFTVAKGSFALTGGESARLKLKLSEKARRYFKGHGRLRSRPGVDTSEQ